MSGPQVTISMDQVFIRDRETLTVWFSCNGSPRAQVELRYHPEKGAEVFLGGVNGGEAPTVKTFNEWEPMP